MIDKAQAYLEKELQHCIRNKKHAIERESPVSETQTAEIVEINEKISILQYLLRCVDAVGVMKGERECYDWFH